MNKKSFLIVLVIFSLFVFVSCQGSEPNDDGYTPAAEEETVDEESTSEVSDEEATTEESNEDEEEATAELALELTLDELSEYDGKDGNRAYVAVEGVIYDVTDIEAWQNGMHNGVEAGNDLTDEIMNQSPHGTSTLSQAKVVGKLIE